MAVVLKNTLPSLRIVFNFKKKKIWLLLPSRPIKSLLAHLPLVISKPTTKKGNGTAIINLDP